MESRCGSKPEGELEGELGGSGDGGRGGLGVARWCTRRVSQAQEPASANRGAGSGDVSLVSGVVARDEV